MHKMRHQGQIIRGRNVYEAEFDTEATATETKAEAEISFSGLEAEACLRTWNLWVYLHVFLILWASFCSRNVLLLVLVNIGIFLVG